MNFLSFKQSSLCIVFLNWGFENYSLALNLKWHYSQTHKAQSTAILCGQLRRGMVPWPSVKLKLWLASFRVSWIVNKQICLNSRLLSLFPRASIEEPSRWAKIIHRKFFSVQMGGPLPELLNRYSWDISKHLAKYGWFWGHQFPKSELYA